MKELEKLLSDRIGKNTPVWNALFESNPAGKIAVAVRPSEERVERIKMHCRTLIDDTGIRPASLWTPEWQKSLVNQIVNLWAGIQVQGNWFPTLSVPRFVHGQSQGICDIFGTLVEKQGDGNYFVHPLSPEPKHINALEPKPVETSIYWGAMEWIRYARKATGGRFGFRNPVITGPLDTANYLLGTTNLLEWVYSEPEPLHRLLDKITGVIIDMLSALRDAAGGTLHGDSLCCMRNLFCLCSECRSLISAKTYEEFEAPYLRRIGEQLGPYGVHSCGSWERTIPSALNDHNLRAMNGQVRENDLALLCRMARGQVVLSIGPSRNLDERFTWSDTESFFRYMLATVPEDQPLETSISETDVELWNRLYREIRGCDSGLI